MTPSRDGSWTVALWLLAVTAVVATAFAASVSVGSDGVDYYQFWAVGQSIRESPGIDIYDERERGRLGAEWLERIEREAAGEPTKLVNVARYRRTFETYSTPFLYTVFAWLATGRWAVDFAAYRIACFAAIVFGLLVLARLCRHGAASALALTTFLMLWFAPLFSELTVANVNPLQLALLAGFLVVLAGTAWRHRTLVGGALLGVTLMFKPNLIAVPAILTVAWAMVGRWRAVRDLSLGGAGGVACGLALSAVSFRGLGAWRDWLGALGALPDTVISRELGNVAPAMILRDGLGLDAAWVQAVVVGVAALAALWSARLGARVESGERDAGPLVALVGLGAALYLLFAKLVWAHYLLLSLPLLVWALRPRDDVLDETESVFRMRLGSALVALVLLSWNPWSAMLRLPYQAYGVSAWLGMLLLAGLAVVAMRSPRFVAAIARVPR